MRIKSELLWGESIQDKSRLYDLLPAGKLPYGYYLLLCDTAGQLEIISAAMQHNRYILSKDCVVFGIAHGKQEAYAMVADIINDVYVTHKYASVKAFAGEVLGEPIC